MIKASGSPLTLLALWTAILVLCWVQELILYGIYLMRDCFQQEFGILLSFKMIDTVVLAYTEFYFVFWAAFAVIVGYFN